MNKKTNTEIITFKNKFKKILALSFLAYSLFSIALPTNTYAAKKPHSTSGLVLIGDKKQAYIAEKMNSFFRPTPGKEIAIDPFTVPNTYTYSKKEINGTKYEQLTPKRKRTKNVIIQMHGGGYVEALGDLHRNLGLVQSRLAGNAEVFYLDYRIAPRYRYPAALEDAVKLYKYLLENGYKGENIAVIGDSAGGNLALAFSLYLRDHNIEQPKALVLISPWGMVSNTLPSRIYNYKKDNTLGENGTPIKTEIVRSSYGRGTKATEPYLSPVYADDFVGLPPMLIQTGSYEVLLDDGTIIAQKAKDSRLKVQYTSYPGMPHDFALVLPELKESQDSFREIENFLKKNM